MYSAKRNLSLTAKMLQIRNFYKAIRSRYPYFIPVRLYSQFTIGYVSLLGKLAVLCSSASLVHSLPHADLENRLGNGLALTPPMGYVCPTSYLYIF